MSNCCKTANPLRRDGTSQPMRLPGALAETYVRVDERSIEDILNFTRQLALEFNFYNSSDSIDGDWTEFFEDDLSFLLAKISLLDLEEYKTVFRERFDAVSEHIDIFGANAALSPKLADLFEWFVTTFDAPNGSTAVLSPFVHLIDAWYELLPESSYFESSDSDYSYKDEMGEARAKLRSFLQKINIAHYESEAELTGFPAITASWYSTDLDASAWEVSSTPDISTRKYFTTSNQADSVLKVLELLKASHDTFVGKLKSLQSSIPAYLEQSFEDYPYHNPQAGLFLAFAKLLQHAQTHINKLGRKHLLYYYEDVLRFSRQKLSPDQAVMIFQLRKGVERHLIKADTLLKAGKDVDDNPLFYKVDEEVVLNQASIAKLMTVFVDRDNTLIRGVYAAPEANSSDGQGADLDEDEPKWNTFGESQYGLEEDARTMVDAEMGFAIASPLFTLNEGSREVLFSFVLNSDTTTFNTVGVRYGAEADLLHGLKAEYTSGKGWSSAEVVQVFIVAAGSHITGANLGHATAASDFGISSLNYTSEMVIAVRILLDEAQPACVVFDEAIHTGEFDTKWPVIKFSFDSSASLFSHNAFGITPLTLNSVLEVDQVRFFEGNAYKVITRHTPKDITDINSTNFELLETLEEVMEATLDAFSASSNYGEGSIVHYNGKAYRSTTAVTGSPDDIPGSWEELNFSMTPLRYLDSRSLRRVFLKVDVQGVRGLLMENDNGKLKAGKPFQPFGAAPVIGSRYYLGSQEIFGKQLSSLKINILWQDPPSDLGDYYDDYEDINSAAGSSTTTGNAKAESDGKSALDLIDEVTSGTSGKKTRKGEASESFFSFRSGKTEGKRRMTSGKEAEESDERIVVQSEDVSISNGDWKAYVELLYQGNWEYMDEKNLFHSSDATNAHTITFTSGSFNDFDRSLVMTEPIRLEPNSESGFLRLELSQPYIAFGHKYYRDLYVAESMRLAKVITDGGTLDASFPSEPYTPVVKELTVDYTSKVTIDLLDSAANVYDDRVEQFFHVHPFGLTEEHPYTAENNSVNLCPPYPDEGYLYIGLADLSTPTTLSMLFQLAEGSADPESTRYAPEWSYLAENKWVDLSASDIVSDSTDELIASGVIRFNLDKEFVGGNTLLDGSYHWLRARVSQNTEAIHKALDILTQAVIVSFYDQENNPEHLRTALAKGTITGLKVNDSSVKKASQPYASFGGKLPEEDDGFLTRVSERLRHKDRSINIWDYERMVLEEFPSIFKVKCLNHTKADTVTGKDDELAPGHVTVVTIPDLRNQNAVNPFEPKTPLHVLAEVEEFLEAHISSWVTLKVANPIYEQVLIKCDVGFLEGKDPGYYMQELNTELKEFLSPWAFDQATDIVFGGNIHRSHIIRFIEQRDYVEFVVNFKMDQVLGDGEVLSNVDEAVAQTTRSILVSSQSHEISSVKSEDINCATTPTSAPSLTNCCNNH